MRDGFPYPAHGQLLSYELIGVSKSILIFDGTFIGIMVFGLVGIARDLYVCLGVDIWKLATSPQSFEQIKVQVRSLVEVAFSWG